MRASANHSPKFLSELGSRKRRHFMGTWRGRRGRRIVAAERGGDGGGGSG